MLTIKTGGRCPEVQADPLPLLHGCDRTATVLLCWSGTEIEDYVYNSVVSLSRVTVAFVQGAIGTYLQALHARTKIP